MQKMEKRQVIVLCITAVVVLYGAFNFIFQGPAKTTASSPVRKASEFRTFATDVTIGISKEVISPVEAYAINRAETEWLRDPFYDKKTYRELLKVKESSKSVSDEKKSTFNYTGYIEYNGKAMAIINGVEYSAGEALEESGYVLRAISPGKVIIENKADRDRSEILISD
jgi:hypothetical protein